MRSLIPSSQTPRGLKFLILGVDELDAIPKLSKYRLLDLRLPRSLLDSKICEMLKAENFYEIPFNTAQIMDISKFDGIDSFYNSIDDKRQRTFSRQSQREFYDNGGQVETHSLRTISNKEIQLLYDSIIL